MSVLVGRFSLSEALIALSWVVIRPSLVGRSGWLSLALVACSSCLTAEAVVALRVGSLCPFLSSWLVRLVLALGWVVTAAVARCLALGWLSVFAALLGSLRLLWLSLGWLVCSGLVGSPCGSLVCYMLLRLLWLAFLSVIAK